MAGEHGYTIIQGPEGTLERDTLQCCHCNKHYVVRPGSGKRRGYCTLCGDVTCGEAACMACVPFEKKLLAMERASKLMAALHS